MMLFVEFARKYQKGTLDDDASWRAYDIPAAVTRRHMQSALKSLGFSYAGGWALSEFCAVYGIDPSEAPALLGAWWVWRSVAGHGRGIRPMVGFRARLNLT